jgi:hypothetical protein
MYEAMRQRSRPAHSIPNPKPAAPAKPRKGLGS